MNQVLIIVEKDVLNNGKCEGLLPSKSGDFAIIGYFLQKNWKVLLLEVSKMQKFEGNVYEVKSEDFTSQLAQSLLQECENIQNYKKPDFNGVVIELQVSKINFQECDLLISRAMPQSLDNIFVKSFNHLQKLAKKTIQNIEEICFYKDKVIPLLLQKNEFLDDFWKLHEKTRFIENFVGEKISLLTTICNVYEEISVVMQKAQKIGKPFCLKPFNLFGGLGVKVFQDFNQAEIEDHLKNIDAIFNNYGVENKMVLIQEGVQFPDFGDVRVLCSFGRFLGAFKRLEPQGKIHNTMHGGVIRPICDGLDNFHEEFAVELREPLMFAIEKVLQMGHNSGFLKNEFICGYDFLLTKKSGKFCFVLTETNIACPTGFSFLDSARLFIQNGEKLTLKDAKQFIDSGNLSVNFALDEAVLRLGF